MSIFLLFLACGTGFDFCFRRWIVRPLWSSHTMSYSQTLTRNEWLRLEFLKPALGDLNDLLSVPLSLNWVPLLVSMPDQLWNIVAVLSVHDVEEVVSWRKSPFRIFIWEVPHELRNVLHLGPQAFHAKLVELWHVNELDAFHLIEQLLLSQNLLEKVFVEHRIVRQIELDYKEVRNHWSGTYAGLWSIWRSPIYSRTSPKIQLT